MKRMFVCLLICCVASLAPAALYDDFEGYTAGNATTVTGGTWVGSNAEILDQSGNNVCDASANGDPAYSALGSWAIPDSDTETTVFFRVYGTGSEDSLIGVTDNSAPSSYSHMQAYVQFVSDALKARDGGSTPTLIASLPDGWYNVWLVINNNANTYDVYVNQGTADAAEADLKADDYTFRYTSSNSLQTFANVYGQGLMFDDVYISMGRDLGNPADRPNFPLEDPITGTFSVNGTGDYYNSVVNGGLTLPGTASVGTIDVPGWDSLEIDWSSDTGTRDNDNSDGDGWHFSEKLGSAGDGPVWNTTRTRMVEGKSYTFLADCQGRWNCDGVTMSVIAGEDPNNIVPGDPNIPLAAVSHVIGGNGVWYNDLAVSYTATAADAGKFIGVKFEGTSTSNIDNSWLRIDNIRMLDGQIVDIHGILDQDPASGTVDMVPGTITLSWTPSNDPNIVAQNLVYYIGDLINFPDVEAYLTSAASVALPDTASTYNLTVDYDQSVLWRVDTIIDANSFTGKTMTFTTQPTDEAPIVEAGSSYITWQGEPVSLAGTVDDLGEGDIADADVIWSIQSLPWTPVNQAAMQMYTRAGDADLATLAANGYDSMLFEDWIGTDARGSFQIYDPLVLTLSGVPAGTYTWTSYHHDAGDQTGPFAVTVIDAAGSAVTSGIDVTAGAEIPVREFSTAIVSDGSDIKLLFDNTGTENSTSFFVMNGFVLSDGINPDLAIDFGTPSNQTASGWQAYTAEHEVASTFTPQSFAALGTTVTVLPEWGADAAGYGYYAAVTKTSTDPLNPTATFDTNVTGDYTIVLTATDTNGSLGPQEGTDTLTVRVTEDPCAAAILRGAGYNPADYNNDCVVDIDDLAAMATQWLDDTRLTDAVAY